MSAKIIYNATDHILQVLGVKNKKTGDALNGAAVRVTLYETDGTTVLTGETWPLTVPYVAASEGNYEVTLTEQLNTENKDGGLAKITIDAGAGLKTTFYCALVFKNRGCCP